MLRILVGAITLVLLATPAPAQRHDPEPVEARRLGRVSFPTSCATEVQEDFESAVAMLHSFWYQAAEGAFRAVASEDPDCVMAYWGVAMSRFRQLWEKPGLEDVRLAHAALEEARTLETSDRERAYLAAVERAYADAGELDHLQRALAYEGAMRQLHQRYPDDPEAAIFYALALLGSASSSPADPAFTRQKMSAAILEALLPSHPAHPGVAHYLIHASDYPALASRGLEAARRYAEIAPDAPHALHMPSHIFTQLGLWEESIASNRAASAAAREDGWIGEELHATDYLTYAYLQMARDPEAAEIAEGLRTRSEELRSEDPNYPAGLYATAAIPARYALERRRWEEAAALEAPRDLLSGGTWCWAEAPLHLARGLGALHAGDRERGRRSMKELEECRQFLLGTVERIDADAAGSRVNVSVWANRLEVQRLALAARLALEEGREEQAVSLSRSAADLEDASDKPPITPGSVVPARELLGELLLEVKRPADALAEFERTLAATPNRFRSLYGAARAARHVGDADAARGYYERLLALTADGAARPEIDEAKEFVGRSPPDRPGDQR